MSSVSYPTTWAIDLRKNHLTYRASSRNPNGSWINWKTEHVITGFDTIPPELRLKFEKLKTDFQLAFENIMKEEVNG